jgi:hypothetical protein
MAVRIERRAPNVADLWDRCRQEHLPRKSVRSQADEVSMWEKIIFPRLGKLRVARVSPEELDSLHNDITNIRQIPVRANRVVEVLRKAFNLAIRWQWIDQNPTSGVRRMQKTSGNVAQRKTN